MSLVQLIRHRRDTVHRWRETSCARLCGCSMAYCSIACARRRPGVDRDTQRRPCVCVSLRGVARRAHARRRRRDGVECAPDASTRPHPHRADATAGSSHAVEEATIRTPKQTLGTCAACARRTAGYIENTKAIFSGDSEKVTVRPVDSPSRGASTSSSFDGALIALLGGGRSSARRGGPERLLVDGATLNKFFVALLQGFIRLE